MATTPGITEDLAQNVAQIYANAETAVIEKLADYTAKGLEQPGWLADELVTVQKFRQQAQTIADDAKAKAMKAALTDADIAAQYGYQSAATEMGDKLAGQIKGKSPHAVTALAAQMHKTTTQATFDIVSSSQKAMHDVVLAASQPALLGVQTPQEAAQKALNVFADQGITSVTYAGKRKVRTEHYVEMAMRTGLMNAALEGHALKMREQGRDLIQVSDHSQECDSCRPYEGKVLSLSNQRGKLELPSAVGEGTATVYVFATLSAAKAKGLFHPNCRHVFRAFIPGVSEEKFLYQTADPAGNKLRVRQRQLERDLREARRREAAAFTAPERRQAKQLVAARRARLEQHIKQNDLKRIPARERITGQFKPTTGKTAPKLPEPSTIRQADLTGTWKHVDQDTYMVPTELAARYAQNNPMLDPDNLADPKMMAQSMKYLDDMAATIRDKGWGEFKGPPVLEVGGDHAVMSDGNHRVWAAQRAGIEEVPMYIRAGEDPKWAAAHGTKVESELRKALKNAKRK